MQNSLVGAALRMRSYFWPAGLLTLGLTLFVGCTPTTPTPQAAASSELTTLVQTDSGIVQGSEPEAGLRVWQGVPFAAPPVGPLRWREPQPVQPWSGVLATTKPGFACVQAAGPEDGFFYSPLPPVSEDCLTLNVWSRATTPDAKLPVMVWIHGGGLTQGSSANYTGEALTAQGVILVTVNYRLGPFGFYSNAQLSAESPYGVSGNQGIADQIASLRWVKNNIANFGGDPNKVTIFGESAGSLSVSLVHASPLAKGLFHRAIGQSGASFQPMTYRNRATGYADSSENTGQAFANLMLGQPVDSKDVSLAALRNLSSAAVLEASQRFNDYARLAIVDGRVIPKPLTEIFAAGEQADVPLMLGSNADEGSAFVPYFTPAFGEGIAGYQAYANLTLPEAADKLNSTYPVQNDTDAEQVWAHLFADTLFTYPQRAWARGMASVSSPAYLYYFTWAPPIPDSQRYGAFHAAEIAYVFGSPDRFGATPTPADYEFSRTLTKVWTDFAKTGDPNGRGIPTWTPYTASNENYLELGTTIELKSHLRMPQVELIEKAFAQRLEAAPK